MAGGRSRSPSTGNLTSSDDREVDFSGAAGCGPYPSYPSIRRRGSYRAIAAPPPPTRSAAPSVAGFFWDALSDVDPHHYLDFCFLCKKHLAGNRDIFMYRGDTPFCSEECRQQQIEVDEAQEKKWKRVAQEPQKNSGGATSPPKSEKLHVRAAGTAVAG